MVFEDKVNVYINSKNRSSLDSVSDFSVVIPQGLLTLYDKDSYFTLNINFFSCFNSWYNCMDNFNNQFQLVYHDNNGIEKERLNLKLTEGNPDVYDVKKNLSGLLYGHVNVNYDKPKNKYTFSRLSAITSNRHTLYLNIINAEDFLGFPRTKRNTLIELPPLTYIYSEQPINVVGDEAITISINGDASLEGNTIDNFSTNEYVPSDIIFCQAIDVPPYALLQYNNEDAGDSFQYRLKQVREITNFRLTVRNQDNEIIPKMTDYLMTLQFVKHKTTDKTVTLLEKMLDYIQQIFTMIGLELYPSSATQNYINNDF
jgi:hypothetical protein